MSNVVFNEEQTPTRQAVSQDPLFVRLLIKYQIVKTRKGAEYVLIAATIVACLVAIIVFPKGRPSPGVNIPVAGPMDTRTR
ncbi:MAG TPA: hypothetical protein VGE48_02195 [Candidatus Paceibacterota bacterium]